MKFVLSMLVVMGALYNAYADSSLGVGACGTGTPPCGNGAYTWVALAGSCVAGTTTTDVSGYTGLQRLLTTTCTVTCNDSAKTATCVKKTSQSYACASGYGSTSGSVTSTTKCYDCTTSTYTTSDHDSSACTTSNIISYNLDGKMIATFKVQSVSTSNCGTCASECYEVSPHCIKNTGGAKTLYGCPTLYATTACSTSGTCANSVKSGTKCVCKQGFYGANPNSCNQCPTSGGIAGTTKSSGKTAITDCYIPAGGGMSDGSGDYTFDEDCYYSL